MSMRTESWHGLGKQSQCGQRRISVADGVGMFEPRSSIVATAIVGMITAESVRLLPTTVISEKRC
jgi:hypothetical protein